MPNRASIASAALALLACAQAQVPEPRAAAQRWAEAIRRGDAGAVYAMLAEPSRQALGREGVERILAQDRAELLARAEAATAANARVATVARVAFAEHRSATLVLEDGDFRVEALGVLPARAATPADALRGLREVLARRSFAGLLRVLTREAGQTLDASLESVVGALADPAAAQIEVDGRHATARLPGGHSVKLEREDGVWRIRDFD